MGVERAYWLPSSATDDDMELAEVVMLMLGLSRLQVLWSPRRGRYFRPDEHARRGGMWQFEQGGVSGDRPGA